MIGKTVTDNFCDIEFIMKFFYQNGPEGKHILVISKN